MLFRIYLFLIFIVWIPAHAQTTITVSSPSNNITYTFSLKNNGPSYSVSLEGKNLIQDAEISFEFADGLFKNNLVMGNSVTSNDVSDYDLFAGKTKHVHLAYHQLIIPLRENVAPYRSINIVVRVFDDGVAFRYEFLKQKDNTAITILDEQTSFKITGDPVVHALLLPNYTSSHEGPYTHINLRDLKQDTLMDMPALFEYPGKMYMAITEAALLDYAGMYLTKHGNLLISKLSPLPGQTAVKVKATLPHNSPWRVLLISKRIGSLLESNIITSLNEPSKIKDLSWLKPGKTTFPWWNGNVVPDTLNAPGNNFVTAQYYIDFCARNNIAYHSVVEYGLHQWYRDDGISFQPGPNADVTTAVPGLDMKQVCDYAKSKGVGIRVWVHFGALYPKLDKAFAIFEQWGISGMMVDFMDRDDQEMVNMQTEILEKAAEHHMHIQFHGAYKPTGINRTYPNEFTREGTLNYEADKWNPNGISPDHDIIMPFTRMLAGSTDYHLGGFRAVTKDKFKANYTRPVMLGTRCHMMAMYVVLENYLQMVCDYPAAYEGQKGFEFIKKVPVTWDEIKVLSAEVNEYINIARRSGNDWYIGSITNHSARILPLKFDFLDKGKYKAEIYTDAPGVDKDPNLISKKIIIITNKDHINLKLAVGGGFVICLKKI